MYDRHVKSKLKNKNINELIRQTKQDTFQLNNEEFPTLSVNQNNTSQVSQQNTWSHLNLNNTGQSQGSISEIFILIKDFFKGFNYNKIIQAIKNTLVKFQNANDNITKMGILFEAIVEIFG